MRRHEDSPKNRNEKGRRTFGTARVYFVDESMPVVLEQFEVKLAGGFVVGRVAGISVAYPPHRIHHLEAMSRDQEWTDDETDPDPNPYERE
jgi:hypothetical protein